MAYILVDPKVLEEKGISRFETIPDGRAIESLSMLKTLGNVKNVEVVSTEKDLDDIIKNTKK